MSLTSIFLFCIVVVLNKITCYHSARSFHIDQPQTYSPRFQHWSNRATTSRGESLWRLEKKSSQDYAYGATTKEARREDQPCENLQIQAESRLQEIKKRKFLFGKIHQNQRGSWSERENKSLGAIRTHYSTCKKRTASSSGSKLSNERSEARLHPFTDKVYGTERDGKTSLPA